MGRRLKANFNDFNFGADSLYVDDETEDQFGGSLNSLNFDLGLKYREQQEIFETNQQIARQRKEPNAWESVPVLGTALDFLGNTIWGAAETLFVPTVVDIASGDKVSNFFGSQDWQDESLAGKVGYALGTGLGFITGVGLIGKGLSWATKQGGKAAFKYYADDITSGLVKIGGTTVSKEVASRSANKLLKTASSAIDDGIKSQLKSTTPVINYFKRKALRDAPLNNPIIEMNTKLILRKEMGDIFGIVDDKLDSAVKLVMDTATHSRSHQFGRHLTQRLMNRGFWGNNPWNKKNWGENVATRIGDALYEGVLLSTHGVVFGELADATAAHLKLTENEWKYETVLARSIHGMLLGGGLSQVRFITGGKAVAWGQSGMINDVKQMTRALWYNWKNIDKMSPKGMQSTLGTIFDVSGKNSGIFKSIPGMGETLLKKKTLSEADALILSNAMKHFKSQLPSTIKALSKEMIRDGFESARRGITGSIVMNAYAWYDLHNQGILFTEEYPWDRMLADAYVGWVYMKRGKEIKTLKGEAASKFPRYFNETGLEAKGNEIIQMERFMDMMGKSDSDLALIQKYRTMDLPDAIGERIEKDRINGNEDLAAINKEITKDFIDAGKLQLAIESNPESKLWSEHVRDAIEIVRNKLDKSSGAEKQKLQMEYDKLIDMKVVTETMIGHILPGNAGKVLKPMNRIEAMDFVKRLSEFKVNKGRVSLTGENVEIELAKLRDGSTNEVTRVIRDYTMDYLQKSLESLGLWSDALIGKDGRIQISKSVTVALDKARNMKVAGETNYEPAFYQLVEMLRQAEVAGVVRLGDKGVRFRTQEIGSLETLEKFKKIYDTYTEGMHDIVFNDGTTSSQWRQIVPGWTKDRGYYDPAIMSSTAIWHSIQTQQRLARHNFAYEMFTGTKNTANARVNEEFLKLRDWFDGNERIAFKSDVDKEAISPELDAFLQRLNYIHGILNPEGIEGTRRLSVSELTNMMEKISDPAKGVGNLFVDGEEFFHFKEYMYQRYINDLTGNPNIGAGLKRVLGMALDMENPLSVRRRGRLELITSRTLRELLLQGKSKIAGEIDPVDKATGELIDLYEKQIERPLRNELSKHAASISFSDELKPSLDFIDKNEIKQTLREMLNQVSRIHEYEFTSIIADVARMGGELDKALARVGDMEAEALKTGKSLDKIKDGIRDIATSQGQLETLISMFISNHDMVSLRILIDSRAKFLESLNELSVDPLTNSKSLIRYKKKLDSYVTEALQKRNEVLDIADIKGVDDYIQAQLDDIALSDRNGKVKTHSHTVSDNQYAMRWHGGDQKFLELIKKKPIDLLNDIATLDQNSKLLIDEYFKDPTILDPASESYIGIQRYVTDMLKPILESQRSRIELLELDKNLGATATEKYENFILDSYAVIVAGLASKRVALGIFDNGTLHISESTISNWDTGINKLQRKLGIGNLDGSLVLAGGRTGTDRGFTTRLNRSVLDQMMANMSKGV